MTHALGDHDPKRLAWVEWKYRLPIPKRLRMPYRSIKRILVVRGGAIGDVLMVTPALRGLRRDFPSAAIVMRTRYPELMWHNPAVTHAGPDVPLVPYDCYIWMKYEDRLPLREHITDVFCRCAGVPPQGRQLDLVLTPEEEAKMQPRLREIRSAFVTLQPWAGPWTQNKNWRMDRWERVVEAINTNYAYEVVQVGTSSEPLVRGAVDWRGRTTLREAALAIRAARFHVGCNSLCQHLAYAVQTPALILYGGATHPRDSAYPGQIALYKGDRETGCYHRQPCSHADVVNALQVEDVLEAIRELMNTPRKPGVTCET